MFKTILSISAVVSGTFITASLLPISAPLAMFSATAMLMAVGAASTDDVDLD